MLGTSELATVLIISLSAAGVIAFAIWILIKQAISQSREAATNKLKAELNAQAIRKLAEANKIAHSPVTDDELTNSLRDGSF